MSKILNLSVSVAEAALPEVAKAAPKEPTDRAALLKEFAEATLARYEAERVYRRANEALGETNDRLNKAGSNLRDLDDPDHASRCFC